MNPNPQSVIPTPPALRWREFRIRFIPGLAFGLALLVAAFLWMQNVTPVSLVGRVETIQADVSSPKPGLLTQLQVARFQKVTAGDPVAQVVITDPQIVAASLAVIQAEVKLLEVGMDPIQSAQRNALSFESLRMNWMRQRIELATARVNLQFAQDELERMKKLYQDKLISEAEFEAAKTKQQALDKEVEENALLVGDTEKNMQRLQAANGAMKEPQTQLQAAIAVQEKKLKLTEAQLNPITLSAPIDGMVTFIHRYGGESVAIGDPVVTVSAPQTDRIVGYLRQPLYTRPEKGMLVRVRTRGIQRLVGQGRILAVGAQLQPLNDAFVPPTRYNNLVELGLPILVSMPNELKSLPGEMPKLHPGELVDLTIAPEKK